MAALRLLTAPRTRTVNKASDRHALQISRWRQCNDAQRIRYR